MIKKIICIGLAVVIIFSLMSCNQGNKLDDNIDIELQIRQDFLRFARKRRNKF